MAESQQTQQSQNTTQSQQSAQSTGSSGTYLPPEKIAALNSLMGFLANPGGGLKNVIQPLLNELVASEDRSRTTLADQFRAAGQSGAGSFAQAARQNESDILRNRQTTATEAGLKYLQPLISGYGTALTGIPALSQSNQQSSSQGTSSGQGASSGQGSSYSPEAQAATTARALGALGVTPTGAYVPTGTGATATGGSPYNYNNLAEPSSVETAQEGGGTNQPYPPTGFEGLEETDYGYLNPGQAADTTYYDQAGEF